MYITKMYIIIYIVLYKYLKKSKFFLYDENDNLILTFFFWHQSFLTHFG